MTAEIILMNKSALAVAADRAATAYGRGRLQISETEKIFPLGDNIPVVAMIYGAAEILDHPWATLIDMYRSQRKPQTLDRVEQYAEEFFRFLESRTELFPAERQIEDYGFIVQQIYAMILHRAKVLIEVAGAMEKRDVSPVQALKAAIVDVHRDYRLDADGKERPNVSIFSGVKAEAIFREHQQMIDDIIKGIFRKRNILSDEKAVLMLRQIAVYALIKDRFHEIHSGVVFAGFGDKDLYPASAEYFVSTVYKNRLKAKRYELARVAPSEVPARVLLFADADATFSFVTGIDEEIFDLLLSFSEYLFEGVPAGLLEDSRLPREARGAINQFVQNEFSPIYHVMLREGLEQYIQDHRIVPLHEMVAVSGNRDLVERASDFVRLNILQKQVRGLDQTVGGGVDTVLITKSKGVEINPAV
jgi:hypothetical protein